MKMHFLKWKRKKEVALGRANISQIHSFINNVQENTQLVEKNKAPVTFNTL